MTRIENIRRLIAEVIANGSTEELKKLGYLLAQSVYLLEEEEEEEEEAPTLIPAPIG